MKTCLLAAWLVLGASSVQAADRLWQQGIWRDQRPAGDPNAAVFVEGVMIPIADQSEFLTIDAEGLRYTVKSNRHRTGDIVNDPMEFQIDGESVYIRGPKPTESYKLRLVTRTRIAPNESAAR